LNFPARRLGPSLGANVLEFLSQYGLFLAKTVTWVVAILVVVGFLANLAQHMREHAQDHLEVRSVNDKLRDMASALNAALLDKSGRKAEAKARKAEEKARQQARKHGNATERPRVFLLDFHGDIRASQTGALREEISAVIQIARERDEVLLRLESQGGMVHGYGLAASQLQRIRDRQIKLTVAVDKVAASGGYLMACVADRIISAPFAILGSIGVVAQLPNFNRLLKKNEIDYEMHTAGEHKRTLTVFGENTEAARAKFREELEDVHALFKSFVTDNRPQLAIEQVATGEHWYGSRALALKLVDEIRTSDDWLLARAKDADIVEVRYKIRPKLSERIAHGFARLAAALRPDRLLP
jgi:serine protease SohB